MINHVYTKFWDPIDFELTNDGEVAIETDYYVGGLTIFIENHCAITILDISLHIKNLNVWSWGSSKSVLNVKSTVDADKYDAFYYADANQSGAEYSYNDCKIRISKSDESPDILVKFSGNARGNTHVQGQIILIRKYGEE